MSQQCMVPGVHRNEGVKMCPKCREDPLRLSHKKEVEAEGINCQRSVLFFS